MKKVLLALLMIASLAFYGCGGGTEIQNDDTSQGVKPPSGPAAGGQKPEAKMKGMEESKEGEGAKSAKPSAEPSEKQPESQPETKQPEQKQP